ncbi:MAG: hypothetical protein SO088_05495, partial [Ruminococcus callidus]|nr:hypothetical protein [Ruminococcus callidus]
IFRPVARKKKAYSTVCFLFSCHRTENKNRRGIDFTVLFRYNIRVWVVHDPENDTNKEQEHA